MGVKTKTSFKKGQSGNLNGRPKKGNSFADILEKVLNEKYVIKDENDNVIKETKLLKKEVLAEAAFQHALKGNVGYLNMLLDRLEGKVPDVLKASHKINMEG